MKFDCKAAALLPSAPFSVPERNERLLDTVHKEDLGFSRDYTGTKTPEVASGDLIAFREAFGTENCYSESYRAPKVW